MAMPAVSRSMHQTTPTRPSISPLSTTSKSLKSSPIATRDATMKDAEKLEHGAADHNTDNGDAELEEHHDDGSSSLSDPDDDNEDAEHESGVDEDTLLADDVAAQRSEVDSEAETERLDQTPQKLRKHADSLGRTPSKLIHAATAEEDISDPPSPLPTGVGAASSTSTVATAGQKRKRSDTAESSLTSAESDLGESPRKRSHELNTDPLGDLDDPVGNVEQSTEPAEDAVDTPTLDERRVTPVPPAKAVKGRKGKQKGRKPKEHIVEPEALPIEDPPEPEEEPSEENAAKTEEELKLKKEASSIFEDVAKQFRAFRERLYNERLAAMTEELQLLSAQDCVHPEYMRQVASVDARLKKQQSEAHAFYNYKMRCIRERTLGERAQLHSQYYQHVRELREDVLYKLGEDWYAIQKERRQSHQEKDDAYIYKFPAKKSVQIRNQAKYNQEVSVLSGVAKYVGFPAAPNINGVEGDSFEDDMKAMKISKRVHQPAAAPPRTVYLPTPSAASFAQNERLAHEQFIEQNPWARPQAPIHSHGTPGISHTPDWAEPNPTAGHSSAKHLIRNLSGIQRNANSPFATPVPQKRTLLELSSSQGTVPVNNSDGPEAPSSVLAAPPTTDRISLLQHGSSNLASPVMIAKHRQNGTELTGFRNFSNISGISGASTIDAPQEPEVDRERDVTKGTMPALMTIPSAPQQIFDTSQLHRHVDERREVYSNPGFRPQEGAFGTPAPLPATTAAP